MATYSRIGKSSHSYKPVLPHKLKSVSLMRQDIQSFRRSSQIMLQEDYPTSWQLQRLYNSIKKDATVISQRGNRKNQTFSSDYSIILPNNEVDEYATKYLHQSKGFQVILNALLDAPYYGYSLLELHPIAGNKLYVELLPRTNVVPQKGLFYPDFLETTKHIPYRDLKEYGTYIFEFNKIDIADEEIGLFNAIAPQALMKKFALSCWSELCEIYGIPPRVLKTNTQDPGMLSRGDAMMRDMGAAAYFIIDETEELSFAQGTTTNGDVYNGLIGVCSNEISLALSGAIYGQDTKHGNRSKDESAQDILWENVLADQEQITSTLNDEIIPALARHGYLKEGSIFKFNKAEDTNKLFEFATKLMAHKDVPNEWIEEKFGVPVLDKKIDSSASEKKEEKLSANLPSDFFD